MLAWKDILVRYKQAALGIGWSLLRPILTMLVFVIVFGKVARLPSDGIPYPLLVLSALLPWMFFSNTLSVGASALIDNAPMLRRTYFPRIIIPTTPVIIHLTDCLLAFFIFLLMSFYYRSPIDARILLFPFLMAHTILLTLGVVYFAASFSAKWRDIIFLIPFIIQIGFFASPIGYSTSLIPEHFKYWFYLNPMVGLVEGFRWALLSGHVAIHWEAYAISLFLSIIFFVSGALFFIRQDKNVMDIL